MHLEWQMTPNTDPHWDIQACYITKIEGDPCIYSKHMIFPETRDGLLLRRGVRVGGDDGDRHARTQRHPQRWWRPQPGCITSADLPLRTFAGRFGTE